MEGRDLVFFGWPVRLSVNRDALRLVLLYGAVTLYMQSVYFFSLGDLLQEPWGTLTGHAQYLLHYNIFVVLAASGMWVYGFLTVSRRNRSPLTGRLLLGVMAAALLLLGSDLPLAQRLPALWGSIFCWGLFCARALLHIAFLPRGLMGRVLGAGTALGILVQKLGTDVAPGLMCPLALLALLFLLRDSGIRLPDSVEEQAEEKDGLRIRSFTCLVLLMTVLHGLWDAIEITAFFTDMPALYGWTRFAYVLGLILAGWLADMQRQTFLMGTFLSMVAAMAALVFVWQGGISSSLALWANTLCEFLSGFFTVYTILVFLRLARRCERPALWAGRGRAITISVNGLAMTAGICLISSSGLFGMSLLYISLLLCFIAFFYRLELSPSDLQTAGMPAPAPLREPESSLPSLPSLPSLRERYGLTPRESEVLAELLEGANIREISGHLNISERTVKFHISHLLQKTGADNRRSLLRQLRAQGRDGET